MQYFDIRQQLRDLFQQTKSALESERTAMLTAVKLIGELHASNPWTNLDITEREFMSRLGISRDRYYSRVRAARALRWFPEVERALLEGKVAISTLGMIESKLTQCNIETVLKNIEGKTKREAALFMSKVTPGGDILDRSGAVEIMVTLTENELTTFNRLREVLSSKGNNPKNSEVLIRAVQDSLEKRDPLRKAQRADDRMRKKNEIVKSLEHTDRGDSVVELVQQDSGSGNADQIRANVEPVQHASGSEGAKQVRTVVEPAQPDSRSDSAKQVRTVVELVQQDSKSKNTHQDHTMVVPLQHQPGSKTSSISAKVRHQVWLRDRGQCTHHFANGTRCDERSHLELDHIQMRCRGGGNEVGNIQLVCRKHNQFRAESVLGAEFMQDKRVTNNVQPHP